MCLLVGPLRGDFRVSSASTFATDDVVHKQNKASPRSPAHHWIRIRTSKNMKNVKGSELGLTRALFVNILNVALRKSLSRKNIVLSNTILSFKNRNKDQFRSEYG